MSRIIIWTPGATSYVPTYFDSVATGSVISFRSDVSCTVPPCARSPRVAAICVGA